MPAFICNACGTQFTPSDNPPAQCPICVDERQFVPGTGQAWTAPEALRRRFSNAFKQHEPGLIGIGTVPQFAINQRALLLQTAEGNILWDCIPLLDEATIQIVQALGGLKAIAISHPHYYSAMVDWSRAFDDAPVYLHAADQRWIMRPDPAIRLWAEDTIPLASGVTLIRCGGHFAGGTVLHWEQGAGGRGAIFSGDIVMVIGDRSHVGFMRSYPNLIPLPASAVSHIGRALDPFAFEAIYGAFFDRNISQGGKAAVVRSVARYINAIDPGAAAD
jgi:glyoxylase-like metal-dependent hydrolase (beta-lactamase superfamily II)